MIRAQCPLCGSTGVRNIYTITRFEEPFEIYCCPECRFQFQDISEEKAYRFYNEAYYKGTADYRYLDERENEQYSAYVWDARIKRLKRELLKTGDFQTGASKFLDVGCSFGGLMNSAEKSGFRSYGAEVSEYSGNAVTERFGNDRIFIGNIEKTALSENQFDAVTMIEVIEHLYNPVLALTNIYRSMKDGGIILIQTADMSGMQAVTLKDSYHYYLPGHLSYFDRHNLAALLKKTGFRKIQYFGGVEFGLVPKLRKSAGSFKHWTDYLKWIRISYYHFLSRITVGKIHLTSSMVIYARK